MGYKEFMGGLFDENLTFLEGMYVLSYTVYTVTSLVPKPFPVFQC